MARFSLSSRERTVSMSDSWSLVVPFVMIRISSRKLNLLWMFLRVLSSVFWNVAGMSESLSNPFMN